MIIALCVPLLLALSITKPVLCERDQEPGSDPRWPIIYSNPEGVMQSTSNFTVDGPDIMRPLNESMLPNAAYIRTFDKDSDMYKEAVFRSGLCKSANCRASYDKWNCGKFCQDVLPDGVVLRAFTTFSLGVTGSVLISEEKKTLYVLLRGASSFRNKILFSSSALVPHPFIKNGRVQQGLLQAEEDIRDIVMDTLTDQLQLHPDYKVDVTGHSFGAGIGSLLTADLLQHMPQLNITNLQGYFLGKARVGNFEYANYFAEKKLKIYRLVEEADSLSHFPDVRDGFVHEGDEYWLKSSEKKEMIMCPGPFETRNCSNSIDLTHSVHHLNYWGIKQDCDTDFFNLI